MLPVGATILILVATVGLGGYLGLLYLRGERRQTLIAVHLLLGFIALEPLAALLGAVDDSTAAHAGSAGSIAVILFAAAFFTGLVTPVFKPSKRVADLMVASHAACGGVGFILFLAWVANL